MLGTAPILPLLKTVFESILEVFLLCVGGYVLARRGILTKSGQKLLNRVNVSIFTPSLLFSKVAFFVTPAKLRELWIIPILFVVTTTVSMAVAYLLGRLLRLNKSQRSFAMAASMFMNSNTLPIALMQSLVVTVPSLKWNPDDNEDTMFGRAITYLVLHSTLGMILRWSYGVRLLSQADPETTADGEVLQPGDHELGRDEEQPLLSVEEIPRSDASSTKGDHIKAVDSANPASNFLGPFRYLEAASMKAQGAERCSNASSTSSMSISDVFEEDAMEDDTEGAQNSRIRRLRRRLGKIARGFYDFMTAPLWAALLSIFVACIPIIQRILVQHAQPIKKAVTLAGNCSIPLTLVVLGAYFYDTPGDSSESGNLKRREDLPRVHSSRRSSESSCSQTTFVGSVYGTFKAKVRRRTEGGKAQGQGDSEGAKRPGETTTVFLGVVVRMILTPALLMPLFMLATRLKLQHVFEDPVFIVSNVLIIASPPALTLAQITQAASGDAFERLISRTVFWAYCIVTPPSTILFVVIGLVLAKH